MVKKILIGLSLAAAMVLAGVTPAFGVQPKNIAVSKVTPSSAVLVVKADVSADVRVDYGSSSGVYTVSKNSLGLTRHEVLLDVPVPSSTIYYSVTITDSATPAVSVTVPEKSCHTARFAGQPFSFGAAGDNRPWSNTTVQPAVWGTIVGQMAAENPDLALNVGDIIYGTPTDTSTQNIAKYDGYFSITSTL